MKVLLADPPAKGTNIDDSYSNLGLLYLAGSLKAAFDGNEVKVRYLGPKHDLKSHLAFVRDYRPDIYAISFASKAAGVSFRTVRAVREMLPDVRIVAGGTHPTALPMDIFERSSVDVVGPGEGEATFTELVEVIAGSERPDLGSVQGIIFRNNGEIVHNERRPVISDLDSIPFPAWEMIDFRDYPGMHLKKQPVESSMLVSRGCPFKCAFCSQPIWKYQKPWLRARSLENICQEIDLLYERGVREIYLTSDELNFNEKWAIDLCEGIAARNYSDLYFQCNLRADKVSERLAQALSGMNCWMVHLGAESANNRVLKGIGKHITVEQVENASRLLSRAGIKVFAFMMLFQVWEENGELCWETPAEVENSLKFMKKMFRQRHVHYMSWQICTPMPGAPLYDLAKRHNLYLNGAERTWETFDEHTACIKIPDVSQRTMQWKIKKGILLKDWFMLRSGGISLRHAWRAWENVRALLK